MVERSEELPATAVYHSSMVDFSEDRTRKIMKGCMHEMCVGMPQPMGVPRYCECNCEQCIAAGPHQGAWLLGGKYCHGLAEWAPPHLSAMHRAFADVVARQRATSTMRKEEIMRDKLFEYAVIYHPKVTKADTDEAKRVRSKLLTEPTSILARDEEEVRAKAFRALDPEYDEKLDQIEVLIVPFA